jgi:transcription-repair coupling factor (superfamily II helicase)
MLNEAIDSKRTGKPIIPPKPNKMFSIDAYIPKDYAINSDKIALYQELENASSAKEVEAFGKRLRDQYGKLPPEVTLLLIKKRIDILASNSEFSSVEEGEKTIDILMSDSFSRINGVGVELFDMITPYLADLKISFLEKKLRLRLEKKEGWLSKLEKILSILHELSLRHSGT